MEEYQWVEILFLQKVNGERHDLLEAQENFKTPVNKDSYFKMVSWNRRERVASRTCLILFTFVYYLKFLFRRH